MLLRSKTLPVIMDMDSEPEYYDNFVHDRIGEWRVTGPGTSIGRLLQIFTKDAPALNRMERLVLIRYGDHPSLDLSSLRAPHLHHLESQFYIKGLFAPQLTHLELWNIYQDRHVALSEVLDILDGLPLLESFRFGILPPDFQRREEAPHRLVVLPNLRFLQFKLPECLSSYLTAHITRLGISTSYLPVASDEPLSSSMAARIPANTTSSRLRAVLIRINNEECYRGKLELKGWSELLDVDLAQERPLPQIHIDVEWLESEHSDFGSFLTSLCRLMGQQDDVEIVHVDFRGADLLESLADITRKVWHDALGGSPVKTLRISCGGGEQMLYICGLLHAVQGDFKKSQVGDSSCSISNPFGEIDIFPTLQKVVLDEVNFTGTLDFMEDMYPQHQKFVDVLPDILSGHARMLVAMHLCVQHCLNVTEEQISQLKTVVGNVSWDGEEIEYDPSEYWTPPHGSSSDSEISECVGQSDYPPAWMLMDPAITIGMELFESDGSSYASSEQSEPES
jgi:hypothetical protein